MPNLLNPHRFNRPFVATWNTANTSTGSSASNQIKLPIEAAGNINAVVDWGDGSSDLITDPLQAELTHTYSSEGIYTINVLGTYEGFRFANGRDKNKILNISEFGNLKPATLSGVFYGCNNLTISATDIFDISTLTTADSFFRECINVVDVPSINNWNFSSCSSFLNFALNSSKFNANMQNIDISSANNLQNMFLNATDYNQPMLWDTSNITTMVNSFRSTSLDQDLSSFNISSLTNASSMFLGTTMSTAKYDALLIGWASQAPAINMNVTFHGGNATYSSAAVSARDVLITTYIWTITDGGLE